MIDRKRNMLTLAMYLNSRGFSFVLFEGTLSPYDWGMFECRGAMKDASCLRKMTELLGLYDIDALVIQHTGADGTRRALRLSMLNTALEAAARGHSVPVFKYSRADVYLTFASAGFANKQSLAEVIAKHIPAFERHVPPPRKPWMSEDARMGLFDAAALALVFFQRANRLELPHPGALPSNSRASIKSLSVNRTDDIETKSS
jgi:Holliday junction resolvasome RuvABC endonuclease subunit